MRIVCIGGGPAGLYFSILVKKARPDWSLTVIERHAAGDTFGWGVVFSDRTIEGLRQADLESHDQILAAFRRWDDIDIFFKGRQISSSGHGFSGIARRKLLAILSARARALGVEFQCGREISDLEPIAQACDLLVGADGVNSIVRRSDEARFRPRAEWSHSRYMWLGTEQKLDAFTFDFQQTQAGWFTMHAYRFDDAMSTVVIEVPEDTWRRAGLDAMGQAESLRFCEQLFAERLGGRRLIASPHHPNYPQGSAVWLSFQRILCERWHVGHRVLLGDAAHTTHFSIGSGTKLAMEDAMALAGVLTSDSDVLPHTIEPRLQRYQQRREPEVLKLQAAATQRMAWFEHVAWHADMPPEQFAYSLLTGSDRVGHRNLARRDPMFIACYEAWFAQRHQVSVKRKTFRETSNDPEHVIPAEAGIQCGAPLDTGLRRCDEFHGQGGGIASARPPRLVPLRLGGLVLKNRLVTTFGSESDAGMVLLHGDDLLSIAAQATLDNVRLRQQAIGLRIDVTGETVAVAHAVAAARMAEKTGFDLLVIRLSLGQCGEDQMPHLQELLAAVRAVWPEEKSICIGMADSVSLNRIRQALGLCIMLELEHDEKDKANVEDRADTLIASGRADLCYVSAPHKSRRW